MKRPVIVGFDGSASAHAAIRYGADEARLRTCELHLLHAFSWPLMYPMFAAEYVPTEPTPRVQMLELLAETAREVQRERPDVVVKSRLVDGSPGGVLVDASRTADLLVVGHRGLGGFVGLLAGSVGTQAAGHGHCPVVVVRGDVAPVAAPIVLGVDGSAAARAAAEVAFATARRRGADVHGVFWRSPHTVRGEAVMAGRHGSSPLAQDELTVGLHGVTDDYDDVTYSAEVVHGDSAATALMTAARAARAGLVVVGSRGLGGFRGLVLGSTSRSLIEHAPCPVMVVPQGLHGPDATDRV